MKTLPTVEMKLWNQGRTVQEFQELLGPKAGLKAYNILEAKYGCASIPLKDLLGLVDKPITCPIRRQHLGLDGPGKLLKEIIAENNKK